RRSLAFLFYPIGKTRFGPTSTSRNPSPWQGWQRLGWHLGLNGSTCLRPGELETRLGALPAKAVLFAATPDPAANDAIVERAREAGLVVRPLRVPGTFRAATLERG
ncbi:hypothetical protein KGQ64_17695, partial [bacterium]|nr:hypothetical protein [bacterium]